MRVLIDYTNNLLSDWQLQVSAMRSKTNPLNLPFSECKTHQLSVQISFEIDAQLLNAKQEQILNDLKSLYDSSYSVFVDDADDNALFVCEYIRKQMEVHVPILAETHFANHLKQPVKLQTNL